MTDTRYTFETAKAKAMDRFAKLHCLVTSTDNGARLLISVAKSEHSPRLTVEMTGREYRNRSLFDGRLEMLYELVTRPDA